MTKSRASKPRQGISRITGKKLPSGGLTRSLAPREAFARERTWELIDHTDHPIESARRFEEIEAMYPREDHH